MLPDYPKVKALIDTYIRERMSFIQKSHLKMMAAARSHTIAEGRKMLILRDDGSISELAPAPVEAKATRQKDEFDVLKITLSDEDKLLHELATGMAAIQTDMAIAKIDGMLRKHGNQISSNQSMEEQYLEGLSRILIGFDHDGQPILPTFLAQSPVIQQRLELAAETVQTDPALRERFNAVIELKRQEWNDREAARNMVE